MLFNFYLTRELGFRVGEREEQICIESFISNSSIEALNEGIFNGFPWPDEIEFHSVDVCPSIEIF